MRLKVELGPGPAAFHLVLPQDLLQVSSYRAVCFSWLPWLFNALCTIWSFCIDISKPLFCCEFAFRTQELIYWDPNSGLSKRVTIATTKKSAQ